MDKNTIIGLLLLFALFLGFSFYNSSQMKKQKEQAEREYMQRMAEELAEQQALALMDTLQKESDTQTGTSTSASTTSSRPAAKPVEMKKPFSTLTLEDESDYVFETDQAYYYIARKGGHITQVELKDVYKYSPVDSVKIPLVMFEGRSSTMNIDLMLHDQTMIRTTDYYFLADVEGPYQLGDDRQKQFSVKLYPTKEEIFENDSVADVLDTESYIEYIYTFTAGDYKFEFDIHFVNMASYLYRNSHAFSLNWDAQLINLEKNYEYERDITTLYYMDNLGEVDNLNERANDSKNFTSPLKWIAYKQQFFTSIMFADSLNFSSGELKVNGYDKNERSRLKEMNAYLDFEIRDLNDGQFDMAFYFGPNQYKLLKDYDLNLERMVPLGWGFFLLQWINRFAVIPIFNWLENYGLNYGIIILILTVFLKLILLPIAYKTYISSARMRVLKPEIEEINARYPKPDDMAKKQQATMALYKSAGVSPMSGCLPMLLQMPILIAMFRFFPSAYELRQQPFLWAEDLSTYDSVLEFGFNIPFYGDHVSLFTLLMTISTLIYTWLNNKMMATSGPEQSQKMMKVMMYMMPILFLGLFNSFPAALTYYYLLVNLITFLQMFIFRMAVNEDKIRERIKLNMKKPAKKSKWQARMEEIAKQQAQLQKNKK